jgi:hypothetical protein
VASNGGGEALVVIDECSGVLQLEGDKGGEARAVNLGGWRLGEALTDEGGRWRSSGKVRHGSESPGGQGVEGGWRRRRGA